MIQCVADFVNSEEGVTSVEYALIAMVMVIVVAYSFPPVIEALNMKTIYQKITEKMTEAVQRASS